MAEPRMSLTRPIPCLHRRQTLDVEARKVLCSACKAEMDPFDLLVRRAREGGYDEMQKREAEKLRKKIVDLLAEEKRVKARTKNASRKDADAAVAHERARLAEAVGRARWAARQVELLARKIQRHLPERPPDA